MEPAVIQDLDIALAPEVLDEGPAEERAAFGLFVIRTAKPKPRRDPQAFQITGMRVSPWLWFRGALTEGFDFYLNGYRQGPLISGYHAAEWFAWHWWRLRWEPRSASTDWELAHWMTSIGEGYVWPNMTIFSDGLRTTLLSRPSTRPDAKPFRYVGAFPAVIPSVLFEATLDAFIQSIVGRLREHGVSGTNLDRLWNDVLEERADAEVAKYRRIEALLGREPDDVEDDAVERLLEDAGRLGEQTLDEVAAAAAHGAQPLSAEAFERLALEQGYEASSRDVVTLINPNLHIQVEPDVAAWRIGAAAAQALRVQERLAAKPIPSDLLVRMAGTRDAAILGGGSGDGPPLSFVLDEDFGTSRVVLRSK